MRFFYSSMLIAVTLLAANAAEACNSAQLIDYDYQAKETLGKGYSTFGRLWALDGKEVCSDPLKYTACIIINPKANNTELQVRMLKNEREQTIYSQAIHYNKSEVVRFSFQGVDVYLKLYVSNTIADMKMVGKSCQSGFPKFSRQVTRTELANMYKD